MSPRRSPHRALRVSFAFASLRDTLRPRLQLSGARCSKQGGRLLMSRRVCVPREARTLGLRAGVT
eukprot:26590-Pleurochrysis_carterae.AAC.1